MTTTTHPDTTLSDTSHPGREPRPTSLHRRGRRSWAGIITGVVLVLLGTAWLLSLTNIIDIRAAYVLPGLLTLVGLALAAGSIRGPHPGLIVVGTLLTIATGFAAVAPPEALRGGIGERHHTATTAADLESQYELGVGDMELDFSELELTGTHEISIMLGAGDLDITLPRTLPVAVTAETGAGEIALLGDKTDGVAVEKTYRSPDYDQATARLDIHVHVGAGSIEVDQ